MGEQIATSGGGSSLYQLVSICQKENLKGKLCYVDWIWIGLEPWLSACPCMPLTRVFQIGVWGISLSGGGSEILFGDFIFYDDGNLRRSDFDYSNLLQGQKQHSVNIEHWLKSKLVWSVCTNSMKWKQKWYRSSDNREGLSTSPPVGKTLSTCVKFN